MDTIDVAYYVSRWALMPLLRIVATGGYLVPTGWTLRDIKALRTVSSAYRYWLDVPTVVRRYDCSVGRRHFAIYMLIGVRVWGWSDDTVDKSYRRALRNHVKHHPDEYRDDGFYRAFKMEFGDVPWCQFCVDDRRDYMRKRVCRTCGAIGCQKIRHTRNATINAYGRSSQSCVWLGRKKYTGMWFG